VLIENIRPYPCLKSQRLASEENMKAQKNPADDSAGFLNFAYKSKLESV